MQPHLSRALGIGCERLAQASCVHAVAHSFSCEEKSTGRPQNSDPFHKCDTCIKQHRRPQMLNINESLLIRGVHSSTVLFQKVLNQPYSGGVP